LATRWQRDGTTGLETRLTWQGLEMLEKLAMLEKAGNAGKSWQCWKKLAVLEKNWVTPCQHFHHFRRAESCDDRVQLNSGQRQACQDPCEHI
jgi:hypothetical protein